MIVPQILVGSKFGTVGTVYEVSKQLPYPVTCSVIEEMRRLTEWSPEYETLLRTLMMPT